MQDLIWLGTTHRHWFSSLLQTEQKEVLLVNIHYVCVCVCVQDNMRLHNLQGAAGPAVA